MKCTRAISENTSTDHWSPFTITFLVALIVWSPPMTSLSPLPVLLLVGCSCRGQRWESVCGVGSPLSRFSLTDARVWCPLCLKTRPANVSDSVFSSRWRVRPRSAAYAGACARPPNCPSFLPSQSLRTHRARRKRRRQRRRWRRGAPPCLWKC